MTKICTLDLNSVAAVWANGEFNLMSSDWFFLSGKEVMTQVR